MSDIHYSLINAKGKILHQIWLDFSGEDHTLVPDEYNNYQSSCIEKNKNLQYMLWTNGQANWFIRTQHPYYWEMYRDYPHPVQRVDALKYFALYTYGGYYLDMDILCLRPVSEYKIESSIYFVETANKTIVHTILAAKSLSNSVLYSIPGHPLWKAIFKELFARKDDTWYYTKHIYVSLSTGPQFITDMYYKNPGANIGIFPSSLFNPCTSCDSLCTPSKGMYTIHYYKATWNEIDSVILNFLNCHSGLVISIAILLVILYLYK